MNDKTRRVTPTDQEAEEIGLSVDATRRVGGNDSMGTRHVVTSANKQTRQVRAEGSKSRILPLGTLPEGHMLCNDCVVIETLSNHERRTPGLYKCKSPEGDVIVKVAAADYPPKEELWNRLQGLRHPNVLRTYRTLEIDGFYYEVQEWCNDGSIKDREADDSLRPVLPEWVMSVLVPHVHAGLEYLHEQDIVHRDIKPTNIYRKRKADGKETLVLGDFDISSVLEQTHTSRDTQRADGTWVYTAPEAFPRFVDEYASNMKGRVSRSSDYYSLGITIIELLQGTTSLHMGGFPDIFDFYLQGNRVAIPQGLPERLNLLLRGLLIRNRQTRWGADEITRWLQDANSADDKKRIRDDESYELMRASQPYRIKHHSPVDLPGLADAMFLEQKPAMEDLMSGDGLLNWIQNIDANKARDIRAERERWRHVPEVALFSAIILCDTSRPFIFLNGSEAYSATEWLRYTEQYIHANGIKSVEYCTDLLLYKLVTWLRFKVEPEKTIAMKVVRIFDSPKNVRFDELVNLIDQERPYSITSTHIAHTPQECSRLTYGKPDDWKNGIPSIYEASYKRWKEGYLYAWMRQRGIGDLVTQATQVESNLPTYPYAVFETVLRLLDPELPPVQVELNLSEIANGLHVQHGGKHIASLPYSTLGCGVPFGGFKLADVQQGVNLTNQLITSRSDFVQIAIDSNSDIPVSRNYKGTIIFESGYSKVMNVPLTFVYGISFPTNKTIGRILIGMLFGAIIFGLPRVWLMMVGETQLIKLEDYDAGWLWTSAIEGKFPLINEVYGFIVMLGALYLVLIWILRQDS